MKKTIFTFLAIAGFGLVSAQTISFDKTTLDYGNIKAGSDGHRVFTIKNTGDKPLILNEVKPACGCTTPEWSKDPILPGKTGIIKVGYNTAIQGVFSKNIEVFSNDPENSRSVIIIKGNVQADAAAAAQQAELVATEATPIMKAKAATVNGEPIKASAKKKTAAKN